MLSLPTYNHNVVCLINAKQANSARASEAGEELPTRAKPVHVASAIAHDDVVVFQNLHMGGLKLKAIVAHSSSFA